MFFKAIFLTVFAYLIGSISTGIVLSKIFGKVNLQEEGSKNIGATNVSRLMGKKWGVITLIGDMLKAMIPIWIGQWVFGGEPPGAVSFYLCLIALAAFLGHLFPIYLGFKGGKGVATALGIFILLGPKTLLVALPLFVLVVYFGKYISLGSIITAGSFPILLILFNYHIYTVFLSIIMAAAIIFKHKDNILRLIKGEEKPWHGKASQPN
ncbi:MAG: glycerol-3-phosphate 1-O-acyltransferase PlsY [Pseudomonadota bacterium]